MTSSEDPVYNTFTDDLVVSFKKIDFGIKIFKICFPDLIAVDKKSILKFINQEHLSMDYIFYCYYSNFSCYTYTYLNPNRFPYTKELLDNQVFSKYLYGPSFESAFTIFFYFYTLHYSDSGVYDFINHTFSNSYVKERKTFYASTLDRCSINPIHTNFYKDIVPYVYKLLDIVDDYFYFSFNCYTGIEAIPFGLYKTPYHFKRQDPDKDSIPYTYGSKMETTFLWQ